MNVISSPSCVMYSLTSSQTLHQNKPPMSLLHRGAGCGLDVLHRRLSTSVFIFHTLLIFSSCPHVHLYLTSFFSFPSLAPAFSTFHSQPAATAVSHFCSQRAFCEDNSFHWNLSTSLPLTKKTLQGKVSDVLHNRVLSFPMSESIHLLF